MKPTAGSMISFQRPDGQQLQGYLATPEKPEGAPAVVVIQEWWGLNDQIRGVADRLAKSGYVALVPDLYRGKMTVEEEEAHHLMSGLDFGDAAGQDVRGAIQYLKQRSERVAVMGYCMGGALTIATAVHVPEVSAGICFYGIPPKEFADPANIKIPFQGHFANRDDWCTPAAVNDLEATLNKAAKTKFEIHRYDANHGFCNERSELNYDTKSANQAWDRMIEFLKATL